MIKSKLFAVAAALGLFAVSIPSASAGLVWNLDTVVNDPPTADPNGTPPWATITLQQMGSHLELKIESKLQGSGEFFNDIALTYSGTVPPVPSISLLGSTGVFGIDSVSYGTVNFQAGEKYNILIDFDENQANRFNGSDVAIFKITPPETLSLADWTTKLAGNKWLVGAHVGGIGRESAFVTTTTFQEIPVPEPSTYIAGALLLIPFLASTMRRFRNK